ncbi:MAG: MBL fold metallo-hydrolase [Candidatus Heimdallarchaeota archaeon]|nr:MBL fold metallo-hydrolase [Candidatus Heimdallarchaeota archaeon]
MVFEITSLGHASFKLKINDKILYIDPYGGDESDYEEKADIILISHKHRDHSDPDKIVLVRDANTQILTSSDNIGNISGKVEALDPGQKRKLQEITVYGVPGYNTHRFRSEGVPFHPKEIQTAFIIETLNKRLYFAGDTDFIDEMKELEDIDIALLPIGGTYTMDPAEALEAVLAIKPKIVLPMHWRSEDPEQFKNAVNDKTDNIEVKILQPREKLVLK